MEEGKGKRGRRRERGFRVLEVKKVRIGERYGTEGVPIRSNVRKYALGLLGLAGMARTFKSEWSDTCIRSQDEH